MNVSGNDHNLEQIDDGLPGRLEDKWTTIRYAISGWGTTVRLLAVLLVLMGPAYLTYLIIWLSHRH